MTIKALKYLLAYSFCLMIFAGCVENSDPINDGAVPIIFDTDMGPDYDDVGAITILHAMESMGEAHILATIGSNKFSKIASLLNLFNTYWQTPDIPIGVPAGDAVDVGDSQKWSDTLLGKYSYSIKSNDEVPAAVTVYRQILTKQPDTSVTIVTVGFLTNMANLLKSESDSISELNGVELVRKKVKRLVSMAGTFPEGREFNIHMDPLSARYAFENWPTTVLFSGYEIGVNIKTGLPLVQNDAIVDNPAKDAYAIAMSKSADDSLGRSSWDLTAVLVGVRGTRPWFTTEPGRISINEDGSNSWDVNGHGQYRLKFKDARKDDLTDTLNKLMQNEPN